MKKILNFIQYTFLVIIINGCTEPYNLNNETFEDLLVIEATLTNEYKFQNIKLSRTTPLDSNEKIIEYGATVYITDSNGVTYNFQEENNNYISENQFSAQHNIDYQLHIFTSDGEEYLSSVNQLTTATELESVTTERINYYGVDGVAIKANSFDPLNKSKYYRYEYEETSKVIVPYWSNDSLRVFGTDESNLQFLIVPRSGPSRTCYKTTNSIDIIQYNTTNQNQDIVEDFIVRFISKDDYTIANGYSVLVKQYIQSEESYNYYKTLKEINSSGNILSPKQPGFINGNIKCISNINKKTIGYFDVSYTSSKRIYFDYENIFQNEPLPPFPIECEVYTYDATIICGPGVDCRYGKLNLGINARNRIISFLNGGSPIYNMVLTKCGDCRVFGTNVKPTFWP